MEDYIEFSGKDVDDAIANACTYFGIDRDKLEIEIESGGSSGIFGLVGVKKARIKARKRSRINDDQLDRPRKNAQPKAPETGQANARQPEKEPVPPPEPAQMEKKPQEPDHSQTEPEIQDAEPEKAPQAKEVYPQDPELKEFISSLMVQLITPLSPDAKITIDDQTRPISVVIKDQSSSELLIGRDGQTLSAIQYIANRIIAKSRPGAARVQLDTEDFLEKQNEKLQQNAYQLATKAKKIGKTMSTKPLSSYHRRIVHMALQSDKKIRTKSKGDGPMKRVLIVPKQRRKKPSQE
ncbi:RNA-binding cell elongation regulator Jag/EloR [Desulfonatronovibrio hydrogenovorans]|uniref:RNA-binding cell elongation regulator Jag/EloR n=1 Tax=Desulfonatronovibrio hydrogenovorans TaxID=53245 RepID=UPI00048F6800|nr:RNA-binding cell elongation regulator Jag/EloR [Desulfonatronovibrio hydrogenovorans]